MTRPDRQLRPEDQFYSFLDNGKRNEAYSLLLKNPEILDGITVWRLRNYYHLFFKGVVDEQELSKLFKALEERVKCDGF